MENKVVLVQARDYLIVVFGMTVMTDVSEELSNERMHPVEDSFRRIAWRSLSEGEKISVTIDWEDARVVKGYYWLTGQDAIMVTFHTIDDDLLGPIIVYIHPETQEILGQALRENI